MFLLKKWRVGKQNESKGLDLVYRTFHLIDKIKPKLPFRENFTANSGMAVEIFIPKIDPDESEWALTIQVTGIDYQIPTSEEQNAKQAFLQASNRIFDWLKLQGINPNKLYIVWADKKYARDKIDSWLKSQ